MNLLAIDCASSILSIAASRGEEIFRTEAEAGMKHSEMVMVFIERCMKEAALSPKELNGVLCMGGPGSFTGLRIGYSIAKGLSLSLSVPFSPVPTLECVAHSCKSGMVLAAIQARKGAYFYAFFKDGQRLQNDSDGETAQIAREIENYRSAGEQKIILCGQASLLLFNSLSDELKGCISAAPENKGYSRELISIAKERKLFENDNTRFLYSGPEYIRKTDTKMSLN